MASINGDWFHSRSSSNLDELLTVRKLVFESQKPEYIGFGWSGGRQGNEKMYKLSHSVGIEPSTMQTKIRAMIRYGFIQDDNHCPLRFSRIGQLWNDLYSIGNYNAAKKLYQITLIVSLSIYAFDDSKAGFTTNPINGELPIRFLFNNLNDNQIGIREFEYLVDGNTNRVGKNISYWKKDLINSGLFSEQGNNLVYTQLYQNFVTEIKNFEPNPLLSDFDWQSVRENPLIEISPFKNSLKQIFLEVAETKELEEYTDNEIITEPLIEIVSNIENIIIPEIDILSQTTQFVKTNRRVRNSVWSTRVKREYQHSCTIPNCDVIGSTFVTAAHIKPDAVPEAEIPHRAHILNGLCLCYHCHIAFDKGFISITDDYKIIVSKEFEKIQDQNLKRVILSSNQQPIKNRIDNRNPILDFVQYHRNNIFIY